MGYEVLGVGDTDVRASSPDRNQREVTLHEVTVITLEPDETWLREDRPRRERQPWNAERWAARPAWLGGTGPGFHLRTNRALAGAVTAALLVGIACGALFTRHHERAVQAEARRRVAVVSSSLLDVAPSDANGVRKVALTVQLQNLGPLPLTLARGAASAGEPRSSAVIRPMAGASEVVQPRGTLMAEVTAPMDCAATSPTWPSIPLRSQDGVVHQVVVPTDNRMMVTPQVFCQELDAGDVAQVEATLIGSLTKPVIHVTNNSSRALRLSPTQPSTDSSGLVSVSFRPRGARTVGAGSTVDFAVVIDVARCEQDLAVRTEAQSQNSYTTIELLEALDQNGAQGVDLSGVIGAALERACH